MARNDEAERWWQADALFTRALEQPAEDRTRFLNEACAGDLDIRRRVERLLAAYEADDRALEGLLRGDSLLKDLPDLARMLGLNSEAPPALPAPGPGRQVGAYRLLKPLHEGGMGAVFLAERADDQYHKQVAVKFIRQGMDSEELRRRFLAERQILARFEHPMIARLHDGGLTEGGAPFLVMEYVEGEPLDAYCDRKQLSVQARLRLFCQVCAAVEYAHRHLIVHRDLKPSNILVTDDGQVKLLDFGIAKLLDQEPAGTGAPLTRSGVRMMTPEYASPEQVKGDAITTASDVYQLGVMLYELLVGRRPYRLKNRTQQEVERVILDVEPAKPSTAVLHVAEAEHPEPADRAEILKQVGRARGSTPERLHRRLKGDLDTICLKALRKEPDRRYPSVAALTEDLRRHLAGLPVLARPDTLGYCTRKFIQRHHVGVGATLLVCVSILGGALAYLLKSDEARELAGAQERLNTYMQDVLLSFGQLNRGREVKVAELLDHAARKAETELADDPKTLANVLGLAGENYQSLGLYEDAEPLLQRALDLRTAQFGPTHPLVAQSLNKLAKLIHEKGDLERAEALYRNALDLSQETVGREHVLTAEILNNLAGLRLDNNAYAAADSLYREALAIRRRILGREHPDVAESLNDLALLMKHQGAYARAESLYLQALAMNRRLLGEESEEVALNLNNLAVLLRETGNLEGAETRYREALAINRSLVGNEHPALAFTLNNLGALLQDQGAYEAADSAYQEAIAVFRKTLPEGHFYTAFTLVKRGQLFLDRGRPGEAETLLQEGHDTFSAQFGAADWRTAEARLWLGVCSLRFRRYPEAETLLLESHIVFRDHFGEEARKTQQAARYLVELYRAWGKPERAGPYERVLEPG